MINSNKIDNKIPTDNSGYSIKLKKSPRISINMEKAMAQGFYPECQIKTTLPANTKEGKRLKQLFDGNKVYKTNVRIVFIDDGTLTFNTVVRDWEGDSEQSGKQFVVYAETEEQKQQLLDRIKNAGRETVEVKEVEEWHHIDTDGRSRLIDINKLVEAGFKVDATTANKEFALQQ